MELFRLLKEDEIELRVGNISKKGYTLLLYKNARADMNILDETIGAMNWQREHYECKGNLFCRVGVNVNYQNKDKEASFIWKSDCGSESDYEKEKGESSDSFKRACTNWGIGRELYTSPFVFIECETVAVSRNGKTYYDLPDTEKFRKFRVSKIDYIGSKISELKINDVKTGQQVFSLIKTSSYEKPKEEKKPLKLLEEVDLSDNKLVCHHCNKEIKENVSKFSKSKFGYELCFDCQKLPKETYSIPAEEDDDTELPF